MSKSKSIKSGKATAKAGKKSSPVKGAKKGSKKSVKGRVVNPPISIPVRPTKHLMWINHFDLLPGDPTVITSFNAITSGVGGGLTGLVIQSTTTGDTSPPSGGIKVVHMGLQVPPGYVIKGVRVCYEYSHSGSFISQIRLDQVQNPPSSSIVRLDDGTDHLPVGPVCVDSAPTTVDPKLGEVLLSIRLNFASTGHKIVIRALGLHLQTA